MSAAPASHAPATGVPPAEPVYLTAAQVAALLQVDEKTVYRWAAQDPTFPVLRIGGTVRFPRARLLVWLRQHEQGPAQPIKERAQPTIKRVLVSVKSVPIKEADHA